VEGLEQYYLLVLTVLAVLVVEHQLLLIQER
jgi:hypothetical protein